MCRSTKNQRKQTENKIIIFGTRTDKKRKQKIRAIFKKKEEEKDFPFSEKYIFFSSYHYPET